jgi:signal transduction histidine kinase
VFQNLLSNAIKFSPSGGAVTIHGQLIAGFVQISVRDRGIGMTAQQQLHLFERFYRADASNTTISGTGLGLAICKLIVELHGGQIWAESEPGVGTTINFTLPTSN